MTTSSGPAVDVRATYGISGKELFITYTKINLDYKLNQEALDVIPAMKKCLSTYKWEEICCLLK